MSARLEIAPMQPPAGSPVAGACRCIRLPATRPASSVATIRDGRHAMLIAATVGFLCGGVLGIRCRVFALVPAHAVAMLLLGGAAWAGHPPLGPVVLAMLGWSLGCHGGYLAAALFTPFRRWRVPPRDLFAARSKRSTADRARNHSCSPKAGARRNQGRHDVTRCKCATCIRSKRARGFRNRNFWYDWPYEGHLRRPSRTM